MIPLTHRWVRLGKFNVDFLIILQEDVAVVVCADRFTATNLIGSPSENLHTQTKVAILVILTGPAVIFTFRYYDVFDRQFIKLFSEGRVLPPSHSKLNFSKNSRVLPLCFLKNKHLCVAGALAIVE